MRWNVNTVILVPKTLFNLSLSRSLYQHNHSWQKLNLTLQRQHPGHNIWHKRTTTSNWMSFIFHRHNYSFRQKCIAAAPVTTIDSNITLSLWREIVFPPMCVVDRLRTYDERFKRRRSLSRLSSWLPINFEKSWFALELIDIYIPGQANVI